MDSGNTTNIPYDYTSVMHYGSKTFVNTSGQMSIVPKPNPNITIGQRTGLSSLDVKRINLLYNCNLCRTKLLGTSGTFSSSDVTPDTSSDNCLWLLHVPSNLVLLQFANFVCSSKKCNAMINVYDGVSKNCPLLAMVSAGQPLPVLISSGKFMLLEYITDPSTPSSFNASYSTAVYGGTFTTDGGCVVSPKYPSAYPNNAIGTYVIIAPPGNQIKLSFSDFNMENAPLCSSDYLMIIDGGDLNAPMLGIYCGKRSNLFVTSSGPTMLLQFSSNSQIKGKGFQADYSFEFIKHPHMFSNSIMFLGNLQLPLDKPNSSANGVWADSNITISQHECSKLSEGDRAYIHLQSTLRFGSSRGTNEGALHLLELILASLFSFPL
ncbi:embryonic protein UVS.2-like [Mantella aurantiaca]